MAANVTVNPYPDFVLKAAADPGWGHFEVYDLVRVFQSGLKINNQVNNMTTTTNAIGAGAILPVIPNQLKLSFSGLYGKGIGRYGSAQLPDVTLDEQGRSNPLTSSQLLASVTYDPTSDWNIYANYGQEQVLSKSWDSANGHFGYGNASYNETGANVLASAGGLNQGNVKRVSQETAGAWYKFYQGKMGKMQAGLQYSHVENKYFAAVGGAPTATDNVFFTSLRYYWQ